MHLKDLQKHVRTLVTLPESDAPFISCYLRLDKGHIKNLIALDEQIYQLKKTLSGQTLQDFEQALEWIEAHLADGLLRHAKGAALFSRAGDAPFFLPLQFYVPLPNWIAVDTVPNIYHLVELKDNYHRYVVMISTKESAQILEINLGAVTEVLWKKHSELRDLVGREWTKEIYQSHRRDRTDKFIKEKIRILDKLMAAGGYTHLILAGPPPHIGRVRSALPKHLAAKLIDLVPASSKTTFTQIVETTLAVFIEAEERESRTVAAELVRQIRTGGLAVAGTVPSFMALKRGLADMLVLLKDYAPDPDWTCSECGLTSVGLKRPMACPDCGSTRLRTLDVKEEMVRLAEQDGCTIEVVAESKTLRALGGIGCLLRYREEYAP